MKVVEGLVALVLLGVAIWGFLRIYANRRRLRTAVFDDATVVQSAVPAVLREAGFSEAIRVGTLSGARGTFDGVVIQAIGADEFSPSGSLAVWTFGVIAPGNVRRLGVSASPQGVRRKKASILIGDAGVDARLDVAGDAADARELFGRPGSQAIVHAITTHGWRLEQGRLVRAGLTVHGLGAVAQAGAAAAKVLWPTPPDVS